MARNRVPSHSWSGTIRASEFCSVSGTQRRGCAEPMLLREERMAFSAPRLTIYALLSSVEEDLREFVSKYLAQSLDAEQLLGSDLASTAERRYRDENGNTASALASEELLPYVDLGDLLQLINRHRALLPHDIRVHLKGLNDQLQLLLPIRNRIAHIRPFRYDDLARVTSFTSHVSSSHPTHWPAVTETVARLTRDPAFIFELPPPRHEEAPDSSFNNLPLPEFDDTGFLGRATEVNTVIGLCKGPWPVISIVGEGGLGKTALALRVAYDLLDDPTSTFDAIIWSSSKTTKLDPTQIREIDGAIRDSLGLLGEIAAVLGGAPRDDDTLLDEIVGYLETFRVLLILDNLETVIDDRIRSFLSRLPAGSKVLITSRIGLGEYEYRVSLQPLPSSDGAALLRAVAHVSGARQLATRPQHHLVELSERMHNNPLFIKWFVAAVQAGVQAERILAEPGLFLDFCMSNVYDHLSTAAQGLLKALLSASEELSLPELIYYNFDDAHETQASIQELLTTNMLVMNSAPAQAGGTVESRYRLTDLARQYLTRNHPLTADEDRDLERVRRRLQEDQRRVSHQIAGDPFDARTFVPRSKSDLLVVVPLLEALRLAGARRFAEALDAVERAKLLAPDYSECFRVEAQVQGLAGNVVVAEAAFQTALSLAQKSAPLRYFHARFLREIRRDVDAALGEVSVALGLANGEPQLLLEGVRCNLETLAFSAARGQLDELLSDHKAHAGPVGAATWQLSAEYWLTKANFDVQTKDFHGAVACLEALRRDTEACPKSLIDSLRPVLQRSAGAAWCCLSECSNDGVQARAAEYSHWLASQKRLRIPITIRLSDQVTYGSVKYYDDGKAFGFINSRDHGEVYFNRSALLHLDDARLLRPSISVSYVLAASERGRRALDVKIV